jgi:hypothetical protein
MYLELTLRTADWPVLAEQLQLEMNREAPMVHHQSTKWGEHPVTRTADGRALRIRWNLVTPGLKATVAELERHVPVLRAESPS